MSDDEPTTPAEMQLLANLDDIMADEFEVVWQEEMMAAIVALRELQERFLRGEISEPQRQELVRILEVQEQQLAELIAKVREHNERHKGTDG